MPLARLHPMTRRFLRIACVLVVAALTSQGCGIPKKKVGSGTNLGSGSDDLPPPGQPSFR